MERCVLPRVFASVPPGGTCDGKPCWKASTSSYGFKDESAANGGLFNIR